MLVFSDSEHGCTQGSFLKRMHARVLWGTDARNQKGHLDGYTQRTFKATDTHKVWGKSWIRATYMRATPLTSLLAAGAALEVLLLCLP